MIRRSAVAWAAVWLLLAGGPALAQTIGFDTEVWTAAEGQATPAHPGELPLAGWRPYQGVLSLGYSDQPYWVRITVHRDDYRGPLVFRLRPAFLDEVDLWLPKADQGWTPMALGDRRRPLETRLHDSAIALEWDDGGALATETVYLRVRTTSVRMANLQVLTRALAQQARGEEFLAFGLYFGIMAVLVLWGLFHAVKGRDALFAWYTAFQTSSLLMNVGLMGVARLWLPPWWSADLWTTGLVLCTSVLAPQMHAALLRSVMAPHALPRHLQWALWCAQGAALANLAQLLWGRVGPALAFNAYIVSALTALLVGMVVWEAWRHRHSPLRRLIVGYVLMCVATMLTLFPLLGLMKGGPWTMYSTSVHGLLVAVLLSLMLANRDAQRRNQQALAQRQAQHEQALGRQAQRERDQREQFVQLLVQQVKTPLAVVRAVLAEGLQRHTTLGWPAQLEQARAAVADIERVVESSVGADRVERGDWPQRNTVCELGDLAAWCLTTLPAAQAHRVRLELPGRKVSVLGHPVVLRSMIMELLDNALKYSPSDSMVTLFVGLPVVAGREQATLRVVNEVGAAGRPELGQVFTRFYRGPAAREVPGSGQGLYTVHGLAQAAGVQLWCDPGAHEGSPVVMELRWT